MNRNVKTILSIILITLQYTSICYGQNSTDQEISDNILKYNSLRTTGTVFMICGIIFGTAAVIMLNTTKKPEPSWMYDQNYERVQKTVGGMIEFAIPATSVGLFMNLWGLHKVNTYKRIINYDSYDKVLKNRMNDGQNKDRIKTVENTRNDVVNSGCIKRDNTFTTNVTTKTGIGNDLLRQLNTNLYMIEQSTDDSLKNDSCRNRFE